MSFIQKIWVGPEILDHLYCHSHRKSGLIQKFWTSCIFIHTENLGWSRNSGPLVFSFTQKIWVDPEILDQLYFHSNRKTGAVQKFWTTCIFIPTENLSMVQKFWTSCIFIQTENLVWSRNSGPVVFSFKQKNWGGPEFLDHTRFSVIQKFWTSCIFIHTENLGWSRNSGPVVLSFTQKIWVGPEILDRLYCHSHRKSGLVQKFWTSCIFIQTEKLGRSRISGPIVFSFIQKNGGGPETLDNLYFHSYRKSGVVQKFWTTCIFIHTENLVWSRNSGFWTT